MGLVAVGAVRRVVLVAVAREDARVDVARVDDAPARLDVPGRVAVAVVRRVVPPAGRPALDFAVAVVAVRRVVPRAATVPRFVVTFPTALPRVVPERVAAARVVADAVRPVELRVRLVAVFATRVVFDAARVEAAFAAGRLVAATRFVAVARFAFAGADALTRVARDFVVVAVLARPFGVAVRPRVVARVPPERADAERRPPPRIAIAAARSG